VNSISTARNYQRGTGLTELIILLPFLLILFLGATDLSRVIYARQTLSDLTREGANLVSRGANSEQALAAMTWANDTVDVSGSASVVISRIRRRSRNDPRPFVYEQQSNGFGTGASKVGHVNGYAQIPHIAELPDGVVITAVEITTPFTPLFSLSDLGLALFPEQIYDAAFF